MGASGNTVVLLHYCEEWLVGTRKRNLRTGYKAPCERYLGKTHNYSQYKPLEYYFVYGAGELAQWLRALAALSEDLGSILSTHMQAYNHL